MYSYILKNDGQGNTLLIKRINSELNHKVTLDKHTLAELLPLGLIESDHIVLHYSKTDDHELNELITNALRSV